MKRQSIRKYLRPYSIIGQRKTTINHTFASAIAPADTYNDAVVADAIRALGQNPENDLACAYCDENEADTWDHVVGLVKDQQFSGFGHTIGNLLPCCRQCNSRKGNKDWRVYLHVVIPDDIKRAAKIATLESYFACFRGTPVSYSEIEMLCPEQIKMLRAKQDQIIDCMVEADVIAADIRRKLQAYLLRASNQIEG